MNILYSAPVVYSHFVVRFVLQIEMYWTCRLFQFLILTTLSCDSLYFFCSPSCVGVQRFMSWVGLYCFYSCLFVTVENCWLVYASLNPRLLLCCNCLSIDVWRYVMCRLSFQMLLFVYLSSSSLIRLYFIHQVLIGWWR